MNRPDWSRRLPRSLIVPGVMTMTTQADVRHFLDHVPKRTRTKDTWRHVESQLDKAARGADPVDVSAAFRLVCMVIGVPCRVGVR